MSIRNRSGSAFQRTPRGWPSASHRGFTLLELMLAMAIMATALAVAWPLLRRPLMHSVTQEAAQQLIATLGDARATAISLGCPVQLYYEPGGQRYQLRPVTAQAVATADPRNPSHESPHGDRLTEGQDFELPIDVSFAAIPGRQQVAASLSLEKPFDTHTPQDAGDAEQLPTAHGGLHQVQWSAPIHFFPDGRADQATVALHGPAALVMEITVRGLTGTATAGTPRKRQQPPLDTPTLPLTDPIDR